MLKKYLRRAMARGLRGRPSEAGRRTFRPRLEWLEQRMAPATFKVLNTGDPATPMPDDGSLREAIIQSNATPGPNLIVFEIIALKGATPTIDLTSALPPVTNPVTIDGLSEGVQENGGGTYTGPPIVVLNGSGAGNNASGLTLSTVSGCTVDGLVIDNFSFAAILITGNKAKGNTIFGNYIGINVAGTAAARNGYGIVTEGAGANTIGGTKAGAGNVISGNFAGLFIKDSGNLVEGNVIGTSADGTQAVPNTLDGIDVQFGASSNTIGGTAAGAGNIISGNSDAGIFFGGSTTMDNVVEGNLIGTNAAGMASLANGTGIFIRDGASDSTIGGTTSGAGNLISGNTNDGVDIFDSGTSGNVVEGNTVGTNAAGTAAVPNVTGLKFALGATNNTIGGTSIAARNVICGNAFGVGIAAASGNVVEGNLIGINAAGAAIGNAQGISVDGGSSGNIIGGTATGAGNVISGNGFRGVDIEGSSTTGNVVEGNRIGTNAAGTAALGNSGDGVFIFAATSNTIGGTTAAARNIISGNGFSSTLRGVEIDGPGATDNVIEGNYIGTDVTGAVALGNSGDGVSLVNAGAGNTLGGTVAGAGNVIAGNGRVGIFVDASSNELIAGNLIGVNAAGTGALGNGLSTSLPGILLTTGSNNNTVGGAAPLARNVISGNSEGVQVNGNSNLVQGNFIGTNAAGTAAVPSGYGILIQSGASGNTIGGTMAGAGNVISGNSIVGVDILNSGTTGNIVAGNSIGTNAAGTAAVPNAFGIFIGLGASGNTVGGTASGAGNVISGNSDNGVAIEDSGTSGNSVEGNFIGTNAAATAAVPNGCGIFISLGASGNTIGGTAAGASNVLSGNSNFGGTTFGAGVAISGGGTTGNVVLGNYIGTNAAGAASLPNFDGILIVFGASGNTIGGMMAGAGNVISGNKDAGVIIADSGTTGNVVEGNDIGTDALGTTALPNPYGVFIAVASGNTIGGTAAGAGNVISGNSTAGVDIQGSGTSGNIVESNFIGTNAAGTADLGNATGILIRLGASGNTIGGILTGAGNVISGNLGDGVDIFDSGTSGNVVEGNTVGTNAAGTAAIPNVTGLKSALGATNNTFGGTSGAARNVIAGNVFGVGIDTIGTSGNLVEGNLIGTNAAGAVIANGVGIAIDHGASGNTIGGIVAGAGNLISGSSNSGTTSGAGVDIEDKATGNVVEGNFIGTSADGSTAVPNFYGVLIASGASGNTIGGITPGAGNVISGNSDPGFGNGVRIEDSGTTGNVVEGNLIGTNAAGTAAVPNYEDVVIVFGATNNTIGGTVAGAGNVISGTTDAGVIISRSGTTGNVVEGNLIGTNAAGTAAIPNPTGIFIRFGATGNTIGGTAPGSGNTISGNTTVGINILSSGTSGNVVDGNLIGTNAAGTAALANAIGVEISAAASANTVGGTSASARNLISGNVEGLVISGSGTTGNLVEGNYVGTNAAGTGALANTEDGIEVLFDGGNNTIGGTTAGAGNVLSGNGRAGIVLSAVDDVLEGNLIGINAQGTATLSNASFGILASAASGNTIGGTAAGAGNVIGGLSGFGIEIDDDDAPSGTNNFVIQGNFIGTDPTGTRNFGNAVGILLEGDRTTQGVANITVGGTAPGAGNVIANNYLVGVEIFGVGARNNIVQGNFIGTNTAGTGVLPNSTGVLVSEGATGNVIGSRLSGSSGGNIIAYNSGAGVVIGSSATDNPVNNSVLSNSIFANGGLGIDLGDDGVTANGAAPRTGPNNLQNFPVLTSFSPSGTVTGTLNGSLPNTVFRIELFANANIDPSGHGQGQVYLGFVLAKTDASGNATFTFNYTPPAGNLPFVSATATDPNGNTSEFSATASLRATHFSVSTPATTPTGAPFSITVTALDLSGDVDTTYRGTISFSSSDSLAGLPVNYTFNGGPGGDNGVHTFTALLLQKAGVQTITVTDTANSSLTSTGTTTVLGLAGDSRPVAMTEDVQQGVVVASFSDANPHAFPGEYTTTIAWGDGSTSTGAVVLDGAGFDVTGTHTYAEEGNYTVSVAIADRAGNTITVNSSAAVAGGVVAQGLDHDIVVFGHKNFTGRVATFTDPDTTGNASDYTAAIAWGDGTTSSGTVRGTSPFTVTGSHTFPSFADTRQITITITDNGGAESYTVTDTVVDPPYPGTPNQLFVSQLYQDLLGRPVDDTGLAAWSGMLDAGATRSQVVLDIENSDEFRSNEVEAVYQRLLHRGADAQGLATFSAFLARGGTVEQVQALIAGSAEYWQKRGGSTKAGFLAALYQDGLSRTPDAPGQASFTQALNSGVSRAQIATAVFSSPEYDQDLVRGLYQKYLGRMPDSFGQALFTGVLQHGARDEAVIAAIAASDEYFSALH
jgi:hypothetical protein